MSRTRQARRLLLASSAVSALMWTCAGSAFGVTADGRVEVPIVSSSPESDVAASVVRLHVPMLKGAASHSAACDWISYERWRDVGGPAAATDADAVVVLQPGILEGASAFDQVARNTVRASARRGRHVEVWAIDRRANCLEDKTGLEYAESTGDLQGAQDYYFRGKVIDGKRFAGWNQDTRVLGDIGLDQVENDYYSVLTSELPSQPWREKHLICGGHSMGGPLTEIFGSWDFDGNKATTDDAGYRQCAGFVGLDTVLNGGVASPKSVPSSKNLLGLLTGGLIDQLGNVGVSAVRSGLVPRYVDLLGISPQTMLLLELVATGADQNPNADVTQLIRSAPQTKSINDFLKLSASPDLASWLFGNETLRNFRWTAMAFLGQILDDNAGVLGLVRSSFGYPTGTPLRRNRLPEQVSGIPGLGNLVTRDNLMLPQKVKPSPLITWANYNELGTGPGQIGAGVTTPQAEVSDAHQVARAIHEGPLNLTEDWFPIRLLVDQALLASGDRTGGLQHSIYGSTMTRKPRIVVTAGDGLRLGGGTTDPNVLAPGYQHLDVLMAAEQQNNGQPEISSTTVANLIDTAVPR